MLFKANFYRHQLVGVKFAVTDSGFCCLGLFKHLRNLSGVTFRSCSFSSVSKPKAFYKVYGHLDFSGVLLTWSTDLRMFHGG